MTTQGNKERDKVRLPPSADGEQEREAPSTSSSGLNVESREFPDQHSDQAESQGPGSPDNPQPQDQNQSSASVEENNDILGLTFPRKLWMLVENDAFRSVYWSENGDSVIIDADLFQTEILQRSGAERIFETDSSKSFIRQLNLYGFSKIRQTDSSAHSQENKRMMIYRNSNFKRDNPLLLQNIQRKGNFKNTAEPVISSPAPKRKKQAAATRHSPRIHKNNPTEEADQNSQDDPPNVQGPSSTPAVMFSSVWAVSSVVGPPVESSTPTQPNVPGGEGTSQNVTPAPQVPAETVGAVAPPPGPMVYPDSVSLISLFNTCYSILLAALSVMSPNEPLEEQQQETTPEYCCAFCEHFKDPPPQ
ncbi:heat shock transcription factor, X-linked member 3-like [Dasypus novemcinctus]|uniref:heat shock transcription factor, X-linked member 3-like n=1 Tax=Dasypus novemcinctus TaxID=9361 RepID=UPI0003289C88|nr:heat shock transcription factor, X-linked member 3-like [Dasypus novemcinctus]